MTSLTKHYLFHGVGITVSGNARVAAAVHSRLRQFESNGCAKSDLTFQFCCVSDKESHAVEKPTGRSRPVYDSALGEVVYFAEDDRLYMSCGNRVRILCDLSRGRTSVSLLRSELDNLWLVSHPMFTIPLIELLKRRGRYSLHAAGLSINGKGLLIAGTSGAGKSTLTIALIRVGFNFLADDMSFLASGRDGLRALAFPDEIGITDQTARLFPELHYLLDQPAPSGWPKRQVPAEQLYGERTIWECRPAAVVFPSVANAEKSILRPMSRDEALLTLVPNVLLTESCSSQSHLDVLAQLVSEAACYRLETGRDFDALPALLREVMEQAK